MLFQYGYQRIHNRIYEDGYGEEAITLLETRLGPCSDQ